MPTLSAVRRRLEKLQTDKRCPITAAIIERLRQQSYKGRLSADSVARLCQQFHLTVTGLALYCVAVSACYARPELSQFYVGAVAVGQSGAFYFGANQEFTGAAMQQTVHAEQSAIAHAWSAGEPAITDIAVNTTPCGHCRQFMNELNTAGRLKIHLPHSQNNLLHDYLPDAFGPKDLSVNETLFDGNQPFEAKTDLIQAAIAAAKQSYAPYSRARSAVALQIGERIMVGRYAENAAFNPSMPPLQSAVNFCRFSAVDESNVGKIVFAEKKALISHRAMTEELARLLFKLPVEYVGI